MAPSTARDKLMKKIIFRHISNEGVLCYRCNKEMTLDTYSIEHIKPWRNEEDAIDIYFDIENVTYSHKDCNVGAARQTRTKMSDGEVKQKRKEYKEKTYCAEKRREYYLKSGK